MIPHNSTKYSYYKAFGKIPEWDIVEELETEHLTIAVALSEEMAILLVNLLNQNESILTISKEQMQ
jgi:hypothetical protein